MNEINISYNKYENSFKTSIKDTIYIQWIDAVTGWSHDDYDDS